jgi:hypothetical protein
MISIRSGVSVGQTVVDDGAEQLKDGAPVTTPGLDQPANPAAPAGSPQQGPDASQTPGAAPAGAPNATAAAQGAGYGYAGSGTRAPRGAGHRRSGAVGAAGDAGSAGPGPSAGASPPGAQPASQP